MDSRRLRYFVQIVDSGSITRAAAAAGVAQPALSQQLAILENELRVKLVERSASGIKATAAGRILYDRAQLILRQYDELRYAVHQEVERLSGTVIIGMSPTMVDRFGLPLIEKVCIQHPQMHLQIIEDGGAQLGEFLANGRIELSISPVRPDENHIVGEEVLAERMLLVYPASWTLADDASMAEIAALPWILTRRPHSVRALVESVFAASGLAPRIVVEIDAMHTVIETVRRGLGATIMPAGVVASDLVAGTLRSRAFGSTPVMRSMYLSHRRAPALTPPAQFVHDILREFGAELRSDEALTRA